MIETAVVNSWGKDVVFQKVFSIWNTGRPQTIYKEEVCCGYEEQEEYCSNYG